jgi:hypothetical protein
MPTLARMRRSIILAALLTLVASCVTDASPASPGASVTNGPSAPPDASDPAAGNGELPSVDSDFPPACEVVTPDELAEIVGNPLADGVGFTNLVCDWESEFDVTSVSLLLQPVPESVCAEGLPEGDPTDQFGAPATVAYDFAASIPGAQVGVCLEAGLVLVTVTGGIDAASDEARYTGEAIEVMELVLGRL